MSNIGIALQLYSLREQAARDLAGALARARDTGFEYVEWSGMPALSAAEIRAALSAAGLKAIGAHCTADDLQTDFAATLQHWHALGIPDLAISGPPAGAIGAADDWRAWTDTAGRWATAVEDAGIRLACHHDVAEATTPPGYSASPLALLLEQTAATPLCAEFDTGALFLAGVNPAEAIRPHPDRCPLLHVKDVAANADAGAPRFVPLGSGALDWQSIFDAAEEVGVEWYVYEQDTPGEDPFEDLRKSYRFLFEYA